MALRADDIAAHYRSVIQRLHQHFSRAEEGYADTDEEEEESSENEHSLERPSQKRKRADARVRDPWNAVTNMKELTIDPTLAEHIQRLRADPKEFMNDTKSLLHEAFQYRSSPADAFVACYSYTLVLQQRRTVDDIRWCFSLLFFFDIVKQIDPTSSGRRVGRLQQSKVRSFLGRVVGSSCPFRLVDATQDINKWARLGRKLNLMCERFGPGCLIFLHQQFSDNL